MPEGESLSHGQEGGVSWEIEELRLICYVSKSTQNGGGSVGQHRRDKSALLR
jgi:hypothetical protein